MVSQGNHYLYLGKLYVIISLIQTFAIYMQGSYDCLSDCHIHDFLILDSGEKAFHYINSLDDLHLPEVIVTDLNMPNMNGVELIKVIKSIEIFQKIPVFILTTSSRNVQIEAAIRQGAAGYFQKPSSFNKLCLLMK